MEGGDGGRASKSYGTNISLKDLIDAEVLSPGAGVLLVQYKQSQWHGDLLESGDIEADGVRFSKPTTFAAAMVHKVNPSLKSKNGWEAIHYEGKCAPASSVALCAAPTCKARRVCTSVAVIPGSAWR